jgi:hypothetical protein
MIDSNNRAGANLDIARDALDNAAPFTAPPESARRAVRGMPNTVLPEDSPVTALGHRDGTYNYLDGCGQLRTLGEKEHNQATLDSLFASDHEWMRRNFARIGEKGEVNGTRYDALRQALMNACFKAGIFDPAERVRGRGAWRGENGQLILHRGDAVFDGRAWQKPSLIGKHLYLADAPLPRPAGKQQPGGPGGPATELIALLNTWNLRRGEIDTRLLLGWMGAAMVGGALDWRPALWVTGGRGSGKSTLHRLISGIMAGAVISVSDATAAGIWQRLGYDSLPVIVDELEPGENISATSNIIRFARLAASGGELARGSADHKARRFTARSCFLFSSILVPPLTPQDRSRIVILNLGELRNTKPPGLTDKGLAELGALILRRLVDQWDRYPETLDRYRAALMAESASAREADVLGTLLTISNLLLSDEGIADDAARREAMQLLSFRDQGDDGGRDEEQCLSHLRTIALPLSGQSRRTADQWISEAFERDGPDAYAAIDTLAGYGMRVMDDKNGAKVLAIANSHDGLRKIFEGTPWAGRSGASGGWVQAFRRLPGATKTEGDEKVRIGRGRSVLPVRVTLIPLALILNVEAIEGRRLMGAQVHDD